jgi:hypothetical protein
MSTKANKEINARLVPYITYPVWGLGKGPAGAPNGAANQRHYGRYACSNVNNGCGWLCRDCTKPSRHKFCISVISKWLSVTSNQLSVKEQIMSAYELETIVAKWEKGAITTEQTVGQILLHIQGLSQRIGNVEKHLARQRRRPDVSVSNEAEAAGERPSIDSASTPDS